MTTQGSDDVVYTSEYGIVAERGGDFVFIIEGPDNDRDSARCVGLTPEELKEIAKRV